MRRKRDVGFVFILASSLDAVNCYEALFETKKFLCAYILVQPIENQGEKHMRLCKRFANLAVTQRFLMDCVRILLSQDSKPS